MILSALENPVDAALDKAPLPIHFGQCQALRLNLAQRGQLDTSCAQMLPLQSYQLHLYKVAKVNVAIQTNILLMEGEGLKASSLVYTVSIGCYIENYPTSKHFDCMFISA
jgi:hypothetical protein